MRIIQFAGVFLLILTIVAVVIPTILIQSPDIITFIAVLLSIIAVDTFIQSRQQFPDLCVINFNLILYLILADLYCVIITEFNNELIKQLTDNVNNLNNNNNKL